MSRQESFESERDTKDGGTQHTAAAGLGVHQHTTSSSPVPPSNSYGGSPFPSAVSQQYPLLDPNVMAVTNTAATIAAVAASALQQINQSKSPPSLTPPLAKSAGATTTSAAVNPAIVAALGGRQHLLPTHQSHGVTGGPAASLSLPTHLAAALLGGPAVNVGGGTALHTTPTPSIHSGLHQALNPAKAALHPAAAAAAHATASSISNALLPNMQSWSLEQLEQHVNLLHQLNQPVPQSVALLLADAQRKEKKRNAKRVANRKSASTSRARKKALVEEMTKINARLKRQALILALLPDLVIAITTDGDITFCSDQVQRVLMHSLDDLQGAKLVSLIAPVSRDALNNLIKEVSKSGSSARRQASRQGQEPSQERVATKRRRTSKQRDQGDTSASKAIGGGDGDGKEAGNDSGRGSSRSTGGSGGDTSAAAVVSEQSFPLSVVEVESKRSAIGGSTAVAGEHANTETNVNSDTSTSNGGKKQLSSLTNSANSASRSPTASSYEEDGGGRGGSRGSRESGRAKGSGTKRKSHSSDDSSSLSSDTKNMRKANDNLDRNVRWHNQRMLKDTKKGKSDFGPKDDVTGASVTANNASARLSSLKHDPFIFSSKSKDDKGPRYERNEDQSSSDDSLLAGVEEKKKTENASDDSGYRESNDSREETSSSGSDTSNSNEHRKKNLASTCKICLIRNDLSTVWCEVTSSVRTRSSYEEMGIGETETQEANPTDTGHPPKPETKELLLCLRPIRDGEKVDEAYRFVPKKTSENDQNTTAEKGGVVGVVSSSGNDEKASTEKNSSGSTSNSGGGSNSNSAGTSSNESTPKRPPKKRPLPKPDCSSEDNNCNDELARKKAKESPVNATDTEKSVVESLMLMNKSQ